MGGDPRIVPQSARRARDSRFHKLWPGLVNNQSVTPQGVFASNSLSFGRMITFFPWLGFASVPRSRNNRPVTTLASGEFS